MIKCCLLDYWNYPNKTVWYLAVSAATQGENMSTSGRTILDLLTRWNSVCLLFLRDQSRLIRNVGVDVKDTEDDDLKRERNLGEYFDFVKSQKRFPSSRRYAGVVCRCVCSMQGSTIVSFACDSLWVRQVVSFSWVTHPVTYCKCDKMS